MPPFYYILALFNLHVEVDPIVIESDVTPN